MYYKDKASYPQGAYYGGAQHQNVRAHGGDMMYGNVMNTIKDYFSNPWVIVISVIIIVIIIAWLMSVKKESYRHY